MPSLLFKIFKPFITRKVYETGRKFLEETENFKGDDWIDYQVKKFDELKNTTWTLKVFPDLKETSYDDLDDFPITEEYPQYPADFPVERIAYTTGTIKRKTIMFTKRDMKDLQLSSAKMVYSLSRGKIVNKSLAVIGGRNYGSGMAAVLLEFMSKKVVTATPSDFFSKASMDRIAKKGPFDLITGIPAFIVRLLDVYGHKILAEDAKFMFGGDVLYDSLVKFIKEKAEEGNKRAKIYNLYVSTETMFISRSIETDKPQRMRYMPELNICHVEGEDGKHYNIFKAPKGTLGAIYPTILRDLVVPKYDIRDLIKVVDFEKGLPIIEVLGRKTYNVTITLPDVGEIKGESGALLKILGIPINTYTFDEVISKILKNYIAVIYVKGEKGNIVFYSDKAVDPEFITKQFTLAFELTPIIHGVESGSISIDVVKTDLDPGKIKVSGKPPLKVPKVIIVRE